MRFEWRQWQRETVLHGDVCEMRDQRFVLPTQAAQLSAEFNPNLRTIGLGSGSLLRVQVQQISLDD